MERTDEHFQELFQDRIKLETEAKLREPFDYIKWQRSLWTDRSIEEISQMAMHHRLTDTQVEQNEEPQSELKVDMSE